MKEPKDWQREIFYLAERMLPKPGHVIDEQVNWDNIVRVNFSRYHVIAEWLTARTQERWDEAWARCQYAKADQGPDPYKRGMSRDETIVHAKAYLRAQACQFAAELFEARCMRLIEAREGAE